jgi:hypothetical protein
MKLRRCIEGHQKFHRKTGPHTDAESRSPLEEHVEMFINWFSDLPKVACTVIPTVEEITVHPARPFEQWVKEHLPVWKVIDNDKEESNNDNRES